MHKRTRRVLFVLLLFCFALPAAAQQAVPQGATSSFTILLANDDGYDAPGLKALIEAFRSVGDVYVSAPAVEQSGKGHSIITTRDPIFVNERKQPDGKTWYAVEGPPATCVRLAIEALLPKRPDIVISGINRGDNLGLASVYLSGTLGAAREAAIVGIPAIAVSMDGNRDEDYAATAAFIRQLVAQLREMKQLKPGLFLNVNAPSGERKGVLLTRLSPKPTLERFERRTSPRGRVYFWSAYRPAEDEEDGTDIAAFKRGFITITPMVLEVTDAKSFAALRRLETKAAAAVPK